MNFDGLYPNPFELNEAIHKARFFLGDRWIVIGDLVTAHDKNGRYIEFPDVEQFLESREHLDDGTLDWAAWGVRLN